ncbi:MAG: sigma-70 family RNA polymerase sigma factor [Propionibacteriaceae bacterium]|jgi:RNA polymerase sigma-70 factor (ECF subfamily)|nr:sigma-70 family RNA polymerase sigma factor [Propionibacteriaceae bacterium]
MSSEVGPTLVVSRPEPLDAVDPRADPVATVSWSTPTGQGDLDSVWDAPTTQWRADQGVRHDEDHGDAAADNQEAQVSADPDQTRAVIERHQQMVYAICVTHTRSRNDADDAFQEVFLTYHRRQPDCVDEEHRKAWLITTALNVCRHAGSTSWARRVDVVSDEAVATLIDADQQTHVDDPRLDALLTGLAGLSPTYRSVVHLFYFEDLSVAQIGHILGLEEGTVKMRLSRGRQMLRAVVTKEVTVHE